MNAGNVIVQVTNHGDLPVQFLEVYALFFDANDQIVSTQSDYACDSDMELKPDASTTVQLNSWDAFDHVEVYLTGRYWNW